MLQRLRVGVLAGLHEVVQVEVARDERGGLAVRLVQRRRADEQRSGPALHHGPSADLVGAGAAGLAAAQAFRSQLPQDAAEYVRLNVLPRPGPQPQPPPQIIGRPDDVERLLDEAGQRAQEVERGAAQAIEETAAVAAEEGEVAVAAKGVGGAFGYLGGLAEGAAALAPTAGEVSPRSQSGSESRRRPITRRAPSPGA